MKEINFTISPKRTDNPLESIQNTIVFSSVDMSLNKRDAWIYGIAVGWDDEDYKEMKKLHKWNDEAIDRNKRMHEKFMECWFYIQDK